MKINKIWLNKVVLIGLLIFVFISIEISQLILLSELISIVGYFNYVVYQILFLSLCFIVIYFILNSRIFRLYFGLVFTIATGFFLVFILLFSGIFQMIFLKIELVSLFLVSLTSFYLSIRFISVKSPSVLNLGRKGKIIMILLPLVSGSVLFLPIQTITINPKTEPEIYFWTSARGLPNNDTLDFCSDNNIGFCIVMRSEYLDDGATREYEDLKRCLDRNVDIYIALGGNSDEFYATTKNSDDFENIFEDIRDWMRDNEIYSDKNLKGFVIDAEPGHDLVNDMADSDLTSKLRVLIEDVPNDQEIKQITEDLENFIDAIHDDNLEIGIVKMPSISDEIDGDNDYSKLMQVFYNIKLNWDFSVSMIYRTQHIPDLFDYFLEDMSNYDYTSGSEYSYLDDSALERYLIPMSTFYYKVAYEINSCEVNVPEDKRYVFIGTFWSKFEDTSYIQNKEYRKDIDVCRHFSRDKVFMYYYHGFEDLYGENELEKMIDYIEEDESWTLAIPSYYLQRELIVSMCYASLDRLVIL